MAKKRNRKISGKRRSKRYYDRNIEKVRARTIYKTAIKTGALIRQPCQVCGDLKTEGHHSDYSKPLEVLWLCKPHHYNLHYPHRVRIRLGQSLKLSAIFEN